MNYLFAVILAFTCITAGTEKSTSCKMPGSYCDLHGSVCVVNNPTQANYKVFVEDSEAFADMLVYETDNSLYADKPGIWYFVKNRDFADFTICFVNSKEKADFSIFYTTMESMAGCDH